MSTKNPHAARARTLARDFDARVLTASAVQIKMDDGTARTSYKKRASTWQPEAWRYYHEVEVIRAPYNMLANIVSRVRIFAARVEEEDQPPVPIEEPNHWANVEMGRLESGDGTGAQLRALSLNLGVPGEAWLIGRIDEDEGEIWKVHSCDEVFVTSKNRWAIRRSPADKLGIELDPVTTVMVHVWQEDPQWSMLPDSAMRPLLPILDELQILSRTIRATGRSRLAGAGVLLWPKEAVPDRADPTRQYEPGQDPFITDLIEAMMTPIADEATAAGVVPLVMKVPAQYIEAVKHLAFDRPLDPTAAQQRKELIQRVAYGLPLPPEMVTGHRETTFANALQISEDLFNAYVEPDVLGICSAYTRGFLRVAGRDKTDVGEVVVWYDPSEVIGHPNQTEDAKAAFDREAISWEALRRALGFNDSDAPDDAELQARLALKKGVVDPSMLLLLLQLAGVVSPSQELPSTGVPPAIDTGGAPVEDQDDEEDDEVVAAAAMFRSGGTVLSHLDRELRRRLIDAADAAVNRALERAGAKLRRKADKQVAGALRDVPQRLVMATAGREVAIALGIEEDEIIAEELAELEDRWEVWVASAQAQVRRYAQQRGLRPDDVDWDTVEKRQEEDRNAGWVLLAGALTALALDRMFNPTPTVPEVGEVDLTVMVSTGIVRSALGRAGGNDRIGTALEELTSPTGEIATGDEALAIYLEVGLRTGAYTWVYGDAGSRSRPFEPHEQLDGVEFQSFDDDVLGNDFDFPAVSHLFPGDHFGCQCSFDIAIEQDLEA